MIVNKKRKKKRICRLVDFAVLVDDRVEMKDKQILRPC